MRIYRRFLNTLAASGTANEQPSEMNSCVRVRARAVNTLCSAGRYIAAKRTNADSATENWNKFREMEDKVEALELENMKLKAKLYDMMTATA